MIQSMTGFGRASGTVGERYSITVSTRSVNHKYLELSIRLPEWLWELDAVIRTLAAETFTRGKVDITVRAVRQGEPDYMVRVNRKIADAVVPQVRAVMEEFGLSTQSITAGDLLRIPDLISVEPVETELDDSERAAFREVVGRSFAAVREMRQVEGEALRLDIASRLGSIREHAQSLATHRDSVVKETLDLYTQRVAEIAGTAGVTVDPDRLAQETVLMVERGDIAEELTRLQSHLKQMDTILPAKESSGKKLDFLTQEVLREINTMGQKSRSSAIRTLVVELKTEVERIREQVQNVE
ncbi:MAG TPA: YicC/YloC family endoribonuclease [Thermoanaerobaculia bacterium]|nr:YicC/YloC family endoribonuclease [Thermoanaerobaculia bacterium]